MSTSDDTVLSILPLIKYYFIGHAQKLFGKNIDDIEYISTSTKERKGVSGTVLISDINYRSLKGEASKRIALKFFSEKSSAINELKNAMELDIKFKSAPEFGIPKVIFASTQDPTLIIYEGVSGINYDEIEIPDKAYEAGRLLATIHGPQLKPVDTEIYQNVIRLMGSHLAVTGKETELSNALRIHFERLEGANSGTNPFSDFHQSNVMLSHIGDEILKAYVIDPEFMQKGRFDRMEDMGTFFGFEMFDEFNNFGEIDKSIKSVKRFLEGYEKKNLENGGSKLINMYPNGNPFPFFIAQWALMDSLDIAFNRGGSLQSKEVTDRINFVLFILEQLQVPFPSN